MTTIHTLPLRPREAAEQLALPLAPEATPPTPASVFVTNATVARALDRAADLLAERDIDTVADSYAGLLRDDGLTNVQVAATSTLTGAGIDDLRGAIARVAKAHNAQTCLLYTSPSPRD